VLVVVVPAAADGPYGGAITEFVARYRPSSNTLVFSTYLGGSVAEIARAVVLDSAENIYILGGTLSPDFQFNQPVFSYPGTNSAFVAVFSPLVAPPPSLQIIRSGSQVLISWPVNATGFGLESSDSLLPATNWAAEPTPPAVVGDQNVVTLEVSAGAKFFRLKKS
jgi:hypothetical protein